MEVSRWSVVVLCVALLTTLVNTAMLVRQNVSPIQPVYVAKELQKDREFKKAVEGIAEDVAQSQNFVDESDVTSIIEKCRAIVGGRLKCD